MKTSLVVLISIVCLFGCSHQPPYELKSPCVSDDIESIEAYNPCVRRPINHYVI